jgi:hypothetical protein
MTSLMRRGLLPNVALWDEREFAEAAGTRHVRPRSPVLHGRITGKGYGNATADPDVTQETRREAAYGVRVPDVHPGRAGGVPRPSWVRSGWSVTPGSRPADT